jgi:hypothetical protein
MSEGWSPARPAKVDCDVSLRGDGAPHNPSQKGWPTCCRKSRRRFPATVAEAVLQILMKADVDSLIGAGRHQRSADQASIAADSIMLLRHSHQQRTYYGPECEISISVQRRRLFLSRSS